MRLPRSSSQPFPIRAISIVILIAFVALLPLCSRAATQQLACMPSKLRFGAVPLGQSETQIIVLTNSGASSTTVSAISVAGSSFKVSGLSLPISLAAGASATLSVTFTPTADGWTGWTEGKVTFTTKAASPSVPIWFSGSGVSSTLLTASPASLSFGKKAVGTKATLPVVLTNPHAHAQTLTAFQAVGSNFSVSGPTMPVTLAPGQSVTLNVTFAPQAAGVTAGSVFVSGPALNLPLSGTGAATTLGQLSISPANLSFGKVLVGDTGTQAAVFTATGGSVTISSAASSSSQFSLPAASFPITIAAGGSVQLNVAFSPQKAGTASAQLSFSSNASDSLQSEPVAGTGAMPHVSLGWSPSTSSVQGYNVYRGTAPGSYTKINSSLDPNTTYTDATVVGGMTYYYAATAVNSSGQESTYSTPVEVAIP